MAALSIQPKRRIQPIAPLAVSEPRAGSIAWLVLFCFSLVWLWALPLPSSFWADETGTLWMADGALDTTIQRCLGWPSQSVLHGVIVWAAKSIGGRSEVVLRLPSLLFLLGAATLLFKLAHRLAGFDAALLALTIFISFRQVIFAAADARPYAGAVFMGVLSMYLLDRWLEGRRWRDAIGYALSAAGIMYFHLLFAALFPVHAVYAWERWRERGALPWKQAAVAIGLLVLALTPLVPQWRALGSQRQSLSFVGTPDPLALAGALAPPLVVIGALIGFIAYRFQTPQPASFHAHLTSPPLFTLLAWATLPPVFLYAVSLLTPNKLFLPRYYLSAAPGMAILAGWLLSHWRPVELRRIIAIAILLVTLGAEGGWMSRDRSHTPENWRAALGDLARYRHRSPNTPIVMVSYLVESNEMDWLGAEDGKVFSPLTAYPLPGDILHLPFRLDDGVKRYLDHVLIDQLARDSEFLIFGAWNINAYLPWLEGRLASQGFRMQPFGNYGGVKVIRFSRTR